MKIDYSDKFIKAAKAAGMEPQKFAEAIRNLLSPSRCRDTRKVFTTSVVEAISF